MKVRALARDATDVAILACGSRHMCNNGTVYSGLQSEVSQWTDMTRVAVLFGDCLTGADAIIEQWLRHNDHVQSFGPFHADWRSNGKSAGPIRNREMLDCLERFDGLRSVLAFWDGRVEKCGTFGVIREATRRGIEVRIVPAS